MEDTRKTSTLPRASSQNGADAVAAEAPKGMPLRFHVRSPLMAAVRAAGGIVGLYKRCTELHTDDAIALCWKDAARDEKRGKYAAALGALRRLARFAPPDPTVPYRMGILHEKMGDDDEAYRCHQRALELDGDQPDAHLRLAILCMRNQADDEAFAHLKKVTALQPNHFAAHYRMGILHERKGQCDEAIGAFKRAREINPTSAKVCQSLGFAYETKGMQAEALACFKEALAVEEIGG